MKSKILKYIVFSLSLSTILIFTNYYFLQNSRKAIVKTKLYHFFSILDDSWQIETKKNYFEMLSPTMLLDGIYKSMEGPKVSKLIQFNSKNELFWVTGFKVEAKNEQLQTISNDYVCHLNIDINDYQYFTQFNLPDRIGKQYPRLTSLSHGLEAFNFPEGYGIPIYGNQKLNITSQSLNHNQSKINLKLKHKITIYHQKENLIPLQSKTVYLELPFNAKNPYKQPLDPASNDCIPVNDKNHVYTNQNGNKLSGHWIIPKGKKLYKSKINHQLNIKDSLCLHFSAPHVHPFATAISLYDTTEKKILFTCNITNSKNKISLQNIETYSSKSGIWFYKNHNYEIHLQSNNTSKIKQDMMASMFLFFKDTELQNKIKN